MAEGILSFIERHGKEWHARIVDVKESKDTYDAIHRVYSRPDEGWKERKVHKALRDVIIYCESISGLVVLPVSEEEEEAPLDEKWPLCATEDGKLELVAFGRRLSSEVPAFEREFDERVFGSRQEAVDAIFKPLCARFDEQEPPVGHGRKNVHVVHRSGQAIQFRRVQFRPRKARELFGCDLQS